MLDRHKIHNSAILKPKFIKCKSRQQTGKHAFVEAEGGYQQCIDCGTIKTVKDQK